MKKIKYVMLLSFSLLGLTACGGDTSAGNSPDEPFEELKTEYVQTNCSIGEAILDIDVGMALETNIEYDISIKPSNAPTNELFFTLSHPNVLQVNFNSVIKSYSFLAKKQGDCIISVRNSLEELIYRNVVKVRNAHSVETMPDYLVSVDKWVGAGAFGDQFQLLFVSATEGIMSGVDQGVNIGRLPFTYEFKEENFNNHEYIFKITEFTTGPTTLMPRLIGVYRNGSLMHLIDNNGPIDLFTPTNN